jgi:hypothetical protein
MALHTGSYGHATQHDVYVRTAEHDGCIYLDLADELWRAVKITPDSWDFVPRPPVRFTGLPAFCHSQCR